MWGRRPVVDFIQRYRELECLWNVSHKDYKVKMKRQHALEQLLQLMKKTDPDANIHTVSRKINVLRCSFNKEHNKVKASRESGGEIHVPKLWYYNLFTFLLHNKDPDALKSANDVDPLVETKFETVESDSQLELEIEEESNQSEEIEEHSEVSHYCETRQDSPHSESASTSVWPHCTPITTNSLKRKLSTHEDNRSKISKNKLKYSAFGEHVAEKLRAMPDDMASYCQRIINDAIFQADFGNLNFTSQIVTNCPPLVTLKGPSPPYS